MSIVEDFSSSYRPGAELPVSAVLRPAVPLFGKHTGTYRGSTVTMQLSRFNVSLFSDLTFQLVQCSL